ncbi:hypothetical protein HU200_034928 [Digitaria exilis]|uniref:Uncharacterized protein n=1 Tax=Digitaria exilis TaxID=1010633 RepID=A0A835BSR0_9POAL|nr:hypothetical protein HU200_034928 [Digitaria exilis]
MLYITSLEESFVNQLYGGNGEINSVGSSYQIPGIWKNNSYNGNGRNTKHDKGQRYCAMVEVDEAESRLSEVGYIGSPSCSTGSPYDTDDVSANCPRQERISYHARQRTSGRSAAFHLHQHGHSFSWRTESSDQNFFDGETEGSREQRRGSSKSQQKHAGATKVGPPGGIGLH